MKGKILFTIMALGASSMAFANGSHMAAAPIAAAEPNYFDGFVVGLDGSMQHLAGNAKDSTKYTADEFSHPTLSSSPTARQRLDDSFASLPLSLDNDIADNTLGGGIFVGYGKVFNSVYYLGGELYARYAHNTINTNTSGDANLTEIVQKGSPDVYPGTASTSMDIDSDWSFGGALKLGYLVTPKTMIYLLAGVENSRFSVNVNHNIYNSSLTEGGLPLNWSNSYSFDENKWAFVPGIGIETMLSDKLSLKAEYTYADYGSFTNHNNSSTSFDPHSESDTYNVASSSDDKVDLNRGLFTLGLSYHFNGI